MVLAATFLFKWPVDENQTYDFWSDEVWFSKQSSAYYLSPRCKQLSGYALQAFMRWAMLQMITLILGWDIQHNDMNKTPMDVYPHRSNSSLHD